MYHRIIDLDIDPWNLSISPENFETQMQIIKKYCIPVKMRDMVRRIKHFQFGKKEIVISFDDAYGDNFYKAKPILEENGIPASFFVVSGAINKKEEFWWDDIERIILNTEKLPQVFEMAIGSRIYHWKISSQEKQRPLKYSPGSYHNNTELSKKELYYALWEILGRLSFKEKKDILKQIASWAGQTLASRSDYLPMNFKEIVSLASSSLFEIGAHTVNHPMLSRLSREEQKEEILQSKIALENIISTHIKGFCYPHGDYSSETLKILKNLGFKYACTVASKAVTLDNNPYLLPRFMPRNWNAEKFENNLRGWLAGYS